MPRSSGTRCGRRAKGAPVTARFDAPFVRWATARTPARFDLAGSAHRQLHHRRSGGRAAGDRAHGRRQPTATGRWLRRSAPGTVCPESGVTTAQGASGANFLVCAALLEPGDEVLVERPGYDALLGTPQLLGARTIRFDTRRSLTRFAVDPDRIRDVITARTRLVVLTSPQNPDWSGSGPRRARGGRADRRALEAPTFWSMRSISMPPARAPADGISTIETAVALGDVFISTSSLTKSYGLSGLRCGWILSSARRRRAREICAPGDRRIRIDRDRAPCRAGIQPDRPADIAGAGDPAGEPVSRRERSSRRDPNWNGCSRRAARWSFRGFAGVDDSTRFTERLLRERETAVVPGRFFDAPAHFRLGFGGSTATLRPGLEAIGRGTRRARMVAAQRDRRAAHGPSPHRWRP